MVLDEIDWAMGDATPEEGGATFDPLAGAVEQGQLRMQWEPVVDLKSGAVNHVRGKLFWIDPDGVAQPPELFMALTRSPGTLLAIFEWGIEQTCLQARRLASLGMPSARAYFKLYAVQLHQLDIARRIERIVATSGVAPQLLGLELRDDLLLGDAEHLASTLKQCRAMGLAVAIDDFGMGYWNPGALHSLPITLVRMPETLLPDMSLDTVRPSLARALMGMARNLGWQVVAKGVESQSFCRQLTQLQCDMVQGPHIGEPMDEQTLGERVASGHFSAAVGAAAQSVSKRTLLLVDDEENILSSLKRLLRKQGYNIITASSGAEGLQRIKETPVHVIVSDQRMPGMTGVEFLRQAKDLCPETIRIVLSGYTELQSITSAINEGAIYKFLTKPWEDELLAVQVEDAFRQYEMKGENLRLTAQVKDMNAELAETNSKLASLVSDQSAQIVREEARLSVIRVALDSLPCPLIGLGSDGMVAFLNLESETSLGLSAGLMLGEQAKDVLPAELQDLASSEDERQQQVTLGGKTYMAALRRLPPGLGNLGRLLVMLPVFSESA